MTVLSLSPSLSFRDVLSNLDDDSFTLFIRPILFLLFPSGAGTYMAAEEEAESETRVAWRFCVYPRRLWF